MRTWQLALPLDPGASVPLFLQIAKGVVRAIEAGRLLPGQALPGIRVLAEQLEVNRNTVQAAYQELGAEGWVQSRSGGGTFVADPLPVRREVRVSPPEPSALGFDLPEAPDLPEPKVFSRNLLACATGATDPRLLPMVALSRAYARAMQGKDPSHLLHGDPQGQPKYRKALAAMLASTRGLSADPGSLLVTGGGKGGLQLLVQALLRPGDRVAVEALGSPAAWEIFRRAGAELLPVPVDAEGLRVEALEGLLREGPLRAIFLTPARQYPTTVSLSAARRSRLLALAESHRFALLEDDRHSEFHFEGAPPLPLGSEDRKGLVITFGSLSKGLFPSLPLAHLQGPLPLIRRLTALQATLHQGADPVLERALAELLEDGEYLRHLNRVRKASLHRRDAFAEALRQELSEVVEVRPPAGGLAFWLAAKGVDVEAWARRAPAHGVTFTAGRVFAYDQQPNPFLRVGFGAHTEEELRAVATRMGRALNDLGNPS